jgi:hypothetical protein
MRQSPHLAGFVVEVVGRGNLNRSLMLLNIIINIYSVF